MFWESFHQHPGQDARPWTDFKNFEIVRHWQIQCTDNFRRYVGVFEKMLTKKLLWTNHEGKLHNSRHREAGWHKIVTGYALLQLLYDSYLAEEIS